MGADAAGTWMLGDLQVARIGYGAMRLTGRQAFGAGPERDREDAVRVLRRAVELGVTHLDTAAFYFSARRSANELINRALSPYPDDLVIATKVGPGRDPSGEWLAARPDQLRGQIEENLRQLGRDHLDVVNLRLMGTGSLADHFGALVELVNAGLVRHLGISNVRPEHLDEALAIGPVVEVQNRFGLGSRLPGSDELLRRCGEEGIAFVPFFAIAGEGREGGAPEEDGEAVAEIARSRGASPAQVRLAWTLHLGSHVLGIPGTGTLAHLEENVAAADLVLTDDDMARLAAVHAAAGTARQDA